MPKPDCVGFSRAILKAGWGGSYELDGYDIQSLALKYGIVVEVPFDPEKHSDDWGISPEPGDPWYELAPELQSSPKSSPNNT